MDTKGLHLEIKDENRGTVSAVFSTFNVIDSDGDVTVPGAFDDGAEVLISAYGHTSWNGMLPVGKGRIRQTRTEAVFEGQFFLDTTPGRDTFITVKELGSLCEWSYGFDVAKESYGEFEGRRVRFLEAVKTFEVSPVLRGAGVDTRTLAVKRDGGPRDELDAGTRAWIREIAHKIEHDFVLEEAQKRVAEHEASQVLKDAARHTMCWYVEVPASQVPVSKRGIAETAISDYSIELRKSPRPSLRWFRPETQDEADFMEEFGRAAELGWGWPYDVVAKADRGANEIWIRTDIPPLEVHLSAAHEVAHLVGADEKAAHLFEAKAKADYERKAVR